MKYYRYYRLLQLKKLSVTFAARYRLQIYSYIYNNNNNNNIYIYIYRYLYGTVKTFRQKICNTFNITDNCNLRFTFR